MKKLFANPIFDSVAKSLLTLLLGFLVYLMVDVRDFIKYKQPATDLEQNKSMISISNRLEQCNTIQDEKNAITQQRIGKTEDKVNSIERKLDIIIYAVTGQQPTAYNQN